MAFSLREQRRFTRRNVAFGERGAKKRREELAGFARMLEAQKAQGVFELQESEQQFEAPEQVARIAEMGAETKRIGLENIAEKFFQGLVGKYAEPFMRKDLGAEYEVPQGPYARLLSREFGPGAEQKVSTPRYDISATAAPPTPSPTEPKGGVLQSLTDAWGRSTRTPVGRAFDLENVTEALRKTWKGLDYIGKGMERGVGRGFKYLFTPRRKEDRRY